MQASFSWARHRRAWLGGSFALVLVLVLAIAGGWWLGRARAAPVVAEPDGVHVLLDLAAASLRAGHRVAPVGSNAFEFYFSVLQVDPHNRTALAQLRAAFRPARDDVERAIAAGDLDEAQRELQLLRAYAAGNYQYDPAHYELHADDYQLALLGGYLDAQRTLLGREHAAEAREISARAATTAAGTP